jgi:putative transposase
MPGHPHVVIHRGHSGQPVFLDAADRALYLASLHEAAGAARVAVHGYALLPAEVRLLVMPATAGGLSEMMQSAGRRYVPAFNRKYGRTGTPWEGRFRSTVIEAERHFADCLRFAEAWGEGANGAAGPATDDVPWSSAAHHLGECNDPLVTDHPAFWAFGNTPFEREAAYRRFVMQPPAEGEVAAISLAALSGWVLGSPAFCATVAQQTGRRPQQARRGRPKRPVRAPDAMI